MSILLTEADPWVPALLLAAAMIAGWTLGWWRGRALSQADRAAPPGKAGEATGTTKMAFKLPNEKERRDVVAYLKKFQDVK